MELNNSIYFIFCSHLGLEIIIALFNRLGSDPAKLFPFDALQDQLRQFGRFGMITATMLLPMLTTAAEAIPDLDELAETFQNVPPTENSVFISDKVAFNKRMRDVVVDMDRLGYI